MKTLSKFLFIVAHSPIGALIIGWSFTYLSDFIPVDKLYETDLLVAFHHPKPSHQIHILIVPKRQIRSLLALTEADLPILQGVTEAAQYLVNALALEEQGFTLLVNGGVYQDVMQIHWHLISDAKNL